MIPILQIGKHTAMRIEVKYPEGWFVWPFGFGAVIRIASSRYEDRAHGSGLPSGIWIDITDYTSRSGEYSPDNRCFDTDGKFVNKASYDGGGTKKVVCYDNFKIELNGLSLQEKLGKDSEITMDKIFTTFRSIK
jgi:hypothetical protein